MAGTAGIPVSENGNAITVEGRVHFALDVGAVHRVGRWPLPLVVAGGMHFEGFRVMASQAGL
jgi:hypothetical protein